jgi:hypothetical protein
VKPIDEREHLKLLEPVPEGQLLSWLREFYGKQVRIEKRELLRHRDLSFVERLWIPDSLPNSLIYKLVLPPWDIEQDLHERVLIPSISNSAQLYLSAHSGPITALFLEDLGSNYLVQNHTGELASQLGEELAKMHRAYSYRIDELMQLGVLRSFLPIDYGETVNKLVAHLTEWSLITPEASEKLRRLATALALKFAGEPTSLVHGDLFAENIIIKAGRLWIIDWSWFALLGTPLLDLATITMNHPKNGTFIKWKTELIESYCYESARDSKEVFTQLPHAETLSRLLFLDWLVERRNRGIYGTTVGPVDGLIPAVVKELVERGAAISGQS